MLCPHGGFPPHGSAMRGLPEPDSDPTASHNRIVRTAHHSSFRLRRQLKQFGSRMPTLPFEGLLIASAGGAQIGEVTDFGTADKPFLIAYARDPEGNVLELEQI